MHGLQHPHEDLLPCRLKVPHAHTNDPLDMFRKIRNKPLSREDIKRDEARQLLADVYWKAIEQWKDRLCKKQEFANRASLMFRKIPIVRGTGDYDTCSFDRLAIHVVFRNELNGNTVAYQFHQRASTAAVYAAARNFLKVSNSISLRLWRDLPWIGRAAKDTLSATSRADSARYLKDTTIVAQAINHKIQEHSDSEPNETEVVLVDFL